MILNDRQIAERCDPKRGRPMVWPFVPEQRGAPSYGLSSFGYDIRVGHQFQVFRNVVDCVDPLRFNPAICDTFEVPVGNVIQVPAHSFTLAASMERFHIPRDVLAVCLGKSTYARCGIIVNVTPLEPEWSGVLTIEISNTTPLPAVVYAGQGIAQLLFHHGESCVLSYADKKGKYQHQVGITHPKG